MKILVFFASFLLIISFATAQTYFVRNIDELNAANKKAKPGDVVMLEDGEWKNVKITLNCSGTKEQPVTFKAKNGSKVLITGNSNLKLGGNFIVVDGLYFRNGYAGKDAVIDFKIDNNQLANNCRVTNCVINDFNNSKRMEQNEWILLAGQYNRLDHCSFINKKNMGVLLAVTLEDDRSRKNFHSIDHNYFGIRPPLGSNGGEIIRVGVSQHCEFNSNTSIVNNFFEHCDGETEIISIKSGSNIVRNNLFYECQGGVVLRHGDNNTVESNIFVGNGKEGTGGVRVINRGQWVVNNLFYKCRGVDFRSPMSVMNGVPNSPANRYVQVTDAVIANNSFFECSPISLCEGSDKERSLPPSNVIFINNNFYNQADDRIYKAYDNIGGFVFINNKVNHTVPQQLPKGFEKSHFKVEKLDYTAIPIAVNATAGVVPDSLQKAAMKRLNHDLLKTPGFDGLNFATFIRSTAYNETGASWFERRLSTRKSASEYMVDCPYADDIYKAVASDESVIIRLIAPSYTFDRPVVIGKNVTFITNNNNTPVVFNSGKIPAVFMITGKGNLLLQDIKLDGSGVRAKHFISSDSSGNSEHYNFAMKKCIVYHLDRKNGCEDLFYAYKSMIADSIVLRENNFSGNNINYVMMNEERDDKGYYNAEKIFLQNNSFSKENGVLMDIYRGGNDESTMGPRVLVLNNKFTDVAAPSDQPFVQLTGAQKTVFTENIFQNCFTGKKLFVYKDIVRADHLLQSNAINRSGEIITNAFVVSNNNTTK
jgi:poly(beta-D-mannuronate) lyase